MEGIAAEEAAVAAASTRSTRTPFLSTCVPFRRNAALHAHRCLLAALHADGVPRCVLCAGCVPCWRTAERRAATSMLVPVSTPHVQLRPLT